MFIIIKVHKPQLKQHEYARTPPAPPPLYVDTYAINARKNLSV